MVTVPALVSVYVTEQLDWLVLAGVRVQGFPTKAPVVVSELLNVTEPVGALGVPPVSVTVAVQVVVPPAWNELGEQLTVVLVVCTVQVIVTCPFPGCTPEVSARLVARE